MSALIFEFTVIIFIKFLGKIIIAKENCLIIFQFYLIISLIFKFVCFIKQNFHKLLKYLHSIKM